MNLSTLPLTLQSARHSPWCSRLGLAAVLLCVLIGLLATGVVRETPTAEDHETLIRFRIIDGGDVGAAQRLDVAGQRQLLQRIVYRVHASVHHLEPLPQGRTREPLDVLQADTGVCFDRSRVIEQAARLAGFEVRRVFLLYGGWRKLLSSGGPSHTLVEARSRQGWVFLGTLSPVTGFVDDGSVWAVKDLKAEAVKGGSLFKQYAWNEIIPTDFLPIYGLYSRHGGHFPPYTPVPDFSPRQVFQAGFGLRIDSF